MLDLAIRNGTLIDGTGAAARRADLGVRDGRIAAIGALDEPARRSIDASGHVVCPGFVDLHTHYDAQAFWDPTLSPSPLHGVTTVIGGNCGFSIAPLAPHAAAYLMRMLSRVEGMPLASLESGVPWDWRSFGEYLAKLDGRLAINAGFLVGHSALRCAVMGERAVGGAARSDDVAAMVGLLRRSVAEGGLGFSSSWAQTHNDGDGQPVPSRAATRDELVALAGALRDLDGTSLEFIPGVGRFSDEQIDVMATMSIAAGRPLNWNLLTVVAYVREGVEQQLSASDYARARGGEVLALTLPQVMPLRLNFVSAFVLDALPGWAEVVTLPLPARKRALADPGVRERLAKGAASPEAGPFRALAVWENMLIEETHAPENQKWRGRNLGECAREAGLAPFEFMVQVALADDLRTSFKTPSFGDDEASWQLRQQVWRDDRALIGASDAGAHLDMIDTFGATTSLLGPVVRDRGLLGLEEAIHQITDRPARLYGLRERGRLAPGHHADVVVFDPATIGPEPVHTRHDLPGGAGRLFGGARGIAHVLVNGVEIVRGQEILDARPGTVLRSGRDTTSKP
ncbi:MAG: amidohydrolase family protein [Myxococcota bacterium]|nr:amidohydrolase family protein [Myxococcota bacterium]